MPGSHIPMADLDKKLDLTLAVTSSDNFASVVEDRSRLIRIKGERNLASGNSGN